eukprot:gb/GECG01005452.1/.p1 GENE.gb/GECG01005452.1/~~gb/GECG01005452.1/.p1  ORF type:complete len:141 (+),score=14.40 gb/GECG01005452.1/:1-423(+)
MASFAIIHGDNPVYECMSFKGTGEDNFANLLQSGEFLIHAALDVVDERQWTSSNAYLRTVDRFHDNQVTAYITPKTRIMIAHKGISEERIHELCKEVHELYLKVLQNPLYEPGTKIWCKNFDKRVRALIKKHLGVQINHT